MERGQKELEAKKQEGKRRSRRRKTKKTKENRKIATERELIKRVEKG